MGIFKLFALVTTLSVVGVSEVQAVTGNTLDPYVAKFIHVGLDQTGTCTLDGYSRTIPIGLLEYNWVDNLHSTTGNAYGICAQFPQPVNPTYLAFSYGLTANDSSNLSHAGHIVETYFGSITNSAMAAGLQLAVWEALYDNGASLNLTDGHFTTASFGDPGTIGSAAYYANRFYAANSGQAIIAQFVAGPTGQTTLTSLSQPSITPSPAAMLPFLIGVVAKTRRRKSARLPRS